MKPKCVINSIVEYYEDYCANSHSGDYVYSEMVSERYEAVREKIRKFINAEPEFSITSGGEFPPDLREYSLVVYCGGCTLNEKEMKHRMNLANEQGVPMVNYGVAIAKMNGILERSVQVVATPPRYKS